MDTIRIAFYGKGGIGKSTISANVSAALAATGKKVLHIGCDPKSDSTRLLTDRRIPTVLSQINCLGASLGRSDIVFPGTFGVQCIEAGGPQAGIGCAGMGITAMEEELKRHGILEEGWDVIIYDVLGDVVCGGFAVPMRKQYVDMVYVVSSADFMSLYAANNILKGIRACSPRGKKLCGGLILNHHSTAADYEIADKFASQTGITIVQQVDACMEISLSDYRRKTVIEAFPESTAAAQLRALAGYVLQQEEGTIPTPMDDAELDAFCSRMFDYRISQESAAHE